MVTKDDPDRSATAGPSEVLNHQETTPAMGPQTMVPTPARAGYNRDAAFERDVEAECNRLREERRSRDAERAAADYRRRVEAEARARVSRDVEERQWRSHLVDLANDPRGREIAFGGRSVDPTSYEDFLANPMDYPLHHMRFLPQER